MWTDTDRSTLHYLCPPWTKQERTPVQKTPSNVKKILFLSCYVLLIWFRELENHEKLLSRAKQGRHICQVDGTAVWNPDWNQHLSGLIAAEEVMLVCSSLDKHFHSCVAFER